MKMYWLYHVSHQLTCQGLLHMWSLLPQQMDLHCSFSVHSLTIYHCTRHVYMLDVCAILYCVYAAGYLLYTYVTHIYTLFLSASCLHAAPDLVGKNMWIFFIFNMYLFILSS